jgi:hypothetical protein
MGKRDNLPTGEGEGGGGGAKSYDGEKAWSSVNHSIFMQIEKTTFREMISDQCSGLHLGQILSAIEIAKEKTG